MYGGKSLDGEQAFDPAKGIRLQGLEAHTKTSLLTEEELEYYASEFSRTGMHGPLNWYRTREVNWEDEWATFFQSGRVSEAPKLEQEVLFVVASRDGALKPELAKHMLEGAEGVVPSLRRREVQAGHWALWERPEEVNGIVREWVEEIVFKEKAGGKASKL